MADAPSVFASVQSTDGAGARCPELTILAACRSGEARLAVWSEIDLESAIWAIPPCRMKVKRDHQVALSPAAVGVLRAQPRYDDTDLVFSSPMRGKSRNPAPYMSLTAVM
jgi:integrase